MVRARQIGNLGVGFLLLGLLGGATIWVIGWVARQAFELTDSLGPQGSATVAAAIVSVGISGGTAFAIRYTERRERIAQEHRVRKLDAYARFLRLVTRTFYGERLGQPLSEHDMLRLMSSFSWKGLLWGSRDVRRAFVIWRLAAVNAAPVGVTQQEWMLITLDYLLKTIRKDLGHRDSGYQAGELLSIWVNDVDLPVMKQRSVILKKYLRKRFR